MNNNQQHVCILLIILCAGLGLYLLVPKIDTAMKTYKAVEAKTQEVEDLKQQVESLKNKKDQYEKAEKTTTKPVYKNEIETTDEMSSFGVMFEDVIQSAKYNGLKLRSISYDTKPANDIIQKNMSNEYNVCAISMQLIGSYMQFRSYFQDIYNYPYLINLDKVEIVPYENNKRILIANVTVTLYSTKTERQKELAKQAAELAAQSAEAAGK